MKKIKIIILNAFILTSILLATPVYAASADVIKIQTFIKSIIQVLVTLAGLISAGFFVWGGVGYMTSSGNPETLDRSKNTIMYSAIGLAVVLGAFVLTNVIADLATGAFGAAQ
jgi:TRAP-type C4-dicarboxylate transport system permease small subunit